MPHQKHRNDVFNEFSPEAKVIIKATGFYVFNLGQGKVMKRSLTSDRYAHIVRGVEGYWFVVDLLDEWEL